MLAQPYERASGKSFTHNVYVYRKRPIYKGLARSDAGVCMSRIFCAKSLDISATEPVSYKWPEPSEIATAMRQVIAAREKAD
jgi:hypothetical protein